MNIEPSFANNLTGGAYPISKLFPTLNGGQVGGSVLQEGMKRLEGLAIPAGLVMNTNYKDETPIMYKTNPKMNVLDENLFDTLFDNISHKKGHSNQSRKANIKVSNNTTRGRK